MAGFFRKMKLKTLTSFWAALGFQGGGGGGGVKWCKSEGVKDKLTPSYIFFGLPRGVKWCKSEGVKDKLPPNSYIVLPPLADQKRCKSGGLICILPPHSYTTLTPWKPNAAQKNVRVLSCIFLKNPPIAAQLLHHFGRKNSTRESKNSFGSFVWSLCPRSESVSAIAVRGLWPRSSSWVHIIPFSIKLNGLFQKQIKR